MNKELPEEHWYRRLNANEKRIIDLFIEMKCQFLISRAELEKRFCKTRIMSSTALTDRLNHLIEKGILGKIRGDKGAVFYAPTYVLHNIIADPVSKGIIDTAVDSASPRDPIVYTVPRKIRLRHVSDEEMSALLVKAQQDWESIGVGSKREKEKVYKELRKARKQLKRKRERDLEDEQSGGK